MLSCSIVCSHSFATSSSISLGLPAAGRDISEIFQKSNNYVKETRTWGVVTDVYNPNENK